MNPTETIDATEVVETRAVAVRPSMAVGQALSVQEIVAQVKLIQEVMREVMKDGEHYGTIPGCGDKKTLLQPGAQKLTMTFRLAPEYTLQEVNLERGHKEYRVICTLKSMASGAFVGQGVGCCSTMESKYRWRSGSRKCPKCGKESVIKGKEQFGGGWLCWKKKDGCGATWPDGAREIEGQNIDRVENPDPADTYNTVLKIAKKRAFVDATITATAASDIFTQDIGDEEKEEYEPPPAKTKTATRQPEPAPTGHGNYEEDMPSDFASLPTTKPGTAPKAESEPVLPFPTEKTRYWAITHLKCGLGEDARPIVTEYLRKAGVLLPNEDVEHWPLRDVPANFGQMRLLTAALGAFQNGEEAKRAFPSHSEIEQGKPKATAAKPEPAKLLAEEPPVEIANLPRVRGKIANVTLKEGKKKDGTPWSLWGIKIGDDWFNSFSNTVGQAARAAKGKEVDLIYADDPKGKTAEWLALAKETA